MHLRRAEIRYCCKHITQAWMIELQRIWLDLSLPFLQCSSTPSYSSGSCVEVGLVAHEASFVWQTGASSCEGVQPQDRDDESFGFPLGEDHAVPRPSRWFCSDVLMYCKPSMPFPGLQSFLYSTRNMSQALFQPAQASSRNLRRCAVARGSTCGCRKA